MELYSIDQADARFGIRTADYLDVEQNCPEALRQPHVVLYHLDSPAAVCVWTRLPKFMKNDMAHFLCFKGEMFAGLEGSPDVVEATRTLYDKRVHFFAPTVPPHGLSTELNARMEQFRRYLVTAKPPVNWEILDPQLRENLLATYLAMCALDSAGPDSKLEKELRVSPVFRNILIEAEDEYRNLKGPYSTLNLGPIDYDRAAPAAATIWNLLDRFRI